MYTSDPCDAETEIFQENLDTTMAADAPASYTVRSWQAISLTT